MVTCILTSCSIQREKNNKWSVKEKFPWTLKWSMKSRGHLLNLQWIKNTLILSQKQQASFCLMLGCRFLSSADTSSVCTYSFALLIYLLRPVKKKKNQKSTETWFRKKATLALRGTNLSMDYPWETWVWGNWTFFHKDQIYSLYEAREGLMGI